MRVHLPSVCKRFGLVCFTCLFERQTSGERNPQPGSLRSVHRRWAQEPELSAGSPPGAGAGLVPEPPAASLSASGSWLIRSRVARARVVIRPDRAQYDLELGALGKRGKLDWWMDEQPFSCCCGAAEQAEP